MMFITSYHYELLLSKSSLVLRLAFMHHCHY